MHLYRENVVMDRFRAAAGAVDKETLGKTPQHSTFHA